ncbi:MAG TPA: phytoene desaturase [Gemmatimonadaceae bacterium]|nr:phytoene desaturase [Gemmatimonadaceae bacterium]
MSPARAVVVGSGFGGLAAAIRLRVKGYDVTVVEALDQPGGRARVFRRNGFTFDAGPTVITAPHLIEELFSIAGRDMSDYVSLVPVDPFYRVMFHDGSQFDYVGDEERLLTQIAQFERRDVDGYRKLAAHAERIFDVGFTQLSDRPFDSLSDMLRILPQMTKLKSYRTVYGLVSHYIQDERLRQLFTFEPLLVGGNPFSTTSIYLLIHWLERKWGVHFAMGGTTAIISALVRLLNELGVEVRVESPVEEIEVRDGKVRGVRIAGGERIAADIVVSNADPSYVYANMLPGVRRSIVPRPTRQSMSLFVAYFGARQTYPDLAHHTILLGPRYRGLLDDVFNKRVLASDFSLYLHAPTRTDASLAPPGSETFYVLSPVPNNKSGIDWNAASEGYFERILNHLEHRLLPGIGGSIIEPFFLTPRNFEDDLRSVDGAAFGPEPILTQSAYFRYHNRSREVEGLYFVGAGTHPGGGVPGVISSAKVLDRIVPTREAARASLNHAVKASGSRSSHRMRSSSAIQRIS